MKNCPSCQLLMDDHEVLCPTCAAERASASGFAASSNLLTMSGPALATATLAPPVAVPEPERVVYRNPSGRRNAVRAAVVATLLAGGLGVLLVMGAGGDGPLAPTLVELGLVEAPAVDVPGNWMAVTSAPGAFSAVLPVGATEVVPEGTSGPEGTWGFMVPLGAEGSMTIMSTPVDRAMDSDPGFAALIAQFATFAQLGDETVQREAPVGNGRAVDAVFVKDDSVTSRARFQLIEGRLYVLVTTGSDGGADALDDAHASLIAGFSPA